MDKDKEIAQAEQKKQALEEQHDRIEKKMKQLQKFEEFLKQVQLQYSDEFTDLSEIDTRYRRLSDTNDLLTKRHGSSGGKMDNIINDMEQFKNINGKKTLHYTN